MLASCKVCLYIREELMIFHMDKILTRHSWKNVQNLSDQELLSDCSWVVASPEIRAICYDKFH